MLTFLIDTQLPPMLATYIRWKGFDAIHTTHFPDGHLLQDADIRQIAIEEDRIILTKDVDFSDAFLIKGPPPRIIYFRLGNIRNRDLTTFLETCWSTIIDLLTQGSGMIILDKDQIASY